MLFNSYIFIFVFLPICLIGYYLFSYFNNNRMTKAYLLGMSLWFYGYFNLYYLLVIVSSMLVNYIIHIYIIKKNDKKQLIFFIGLLFNIVLLICFKYLDFIFLNLNHLLKTDFKLINVVLPLGISFFTFQQISFLADVYKQKVNKCDFLSYTSYVSFFPQLIAGPIVLHSELIPQLNEERKKRINFENISRGMYIFIIGLSKKVLIADVLGEAVSWGYKIIDSLDSTNAVLIILSYTFQIYFDFSGYCDMAIGISKMFNIDLPINFNSPYRSKNIGEFWERWHITLTRFFTLYVYIPLGGNRKGIVRTCVNMFIIFLLSGIWHGAGWTYIIWGMMHGVALIVYRLGKKYIDKIPTALNWIITFTFINITWIFFRAESLSSAIKILKKVFECRFGEINKELYNCFFNTDLQIVNKIVPIHSLYKYSSVIIWLGLSFFICMKKSNSYDMMKKFYPNIMNCIIMTGLLVWSICSLSGVSTFLYFNF